MKKAQPMRIHLARPLDELQEAALLAVDRHTDVRRGRTASQAHMDAVKLMEARRLLDGGSSDLLKREAAIRKIEPSELAERVIKAAAASATLELDRVTLKEAIRAATDHRTVTKLLFDRGVPFPPGKFA